MANFFETVDKEFEYEGKEYWYVAEVQCKYEYTPATWDSPQEEEWEADADIQEVTTSVDNWETEIKLNVLKIDKKLQEAIEEDAEKEAYTCV